MKIIYVIAICICLVIVNANVYSQLNLVPNPSFGKLDGKVKKEGQIGLVKGWSSPTEKQADIYAEESKNEAFGIPNNAYGKQDSKDDFNYVHYKERYHENNYRCIFILWWMWEYYHKCDDREDYVDE